MSNIRKHFYKPGDRFGRLVLVSVFKDGAIEKWHAKCDCGTETTPTTANLSSGKCNSCGCLNREQTIQRSTKHGFCTKGINPLYSVWQGVMDRCYNPNSEVYKDYGGRGIFVVDRWHEVTAFIADMGERPTPKHTVERIDNNGPYGPDNCRWATRLEQARNRRNTYRFTFNGETMTINEWSDKTGINEATIRRRLIGAKWTVEDALTLAAHSGNRRK